MLDLLLLLLLGSVPAQSATPPSSGQNQTTSPGAAAKRDPEIAAKLLNVRRIYVDTFGSDAQSQQLQAMVINSLAESKRFIITENKDKADAILRGVGLEKSAQEFHAISEGTAVGTAAGSQHGHVNGNVSGGSGSISGSSSGGFSSKILPPRTPRPQRKL